MIIIVMMIIITLTLRKAGFIIANLHESRPQSIEKRSRCLYYYLPEASFALGLPLSQFTWPCPDDPNVRKPP